MENSEDSQDSVVFHSSSSEKNYDEDVSNCSTVVTKFEQCSVKDDGNLTKVHSEQQSLISNHVQSSKSIDSTLMDLDIRKDCATNTDNDNMIVRKVETCEQGTVTDRYLMYKKKWKSTKRIQSNNPSSDSNRKRKYKYYNKKYHVNNNYNTYNNKYDLPYGFRKTWEHRAYEMKQQQIKEILSRSYYYFTRFMHSLDHMKF